MPEIDYQGLIQGEFKALREEESRARAERATADDAEKKKLDARLKAIEERQGEILASQKQSALLSLPGIKVGSGKGEASWGRIAKLVAGTAKMSDAEYGVEAEIYKTMLDRKGELDTITKTAMNAATGSAGGFLIPSEMMKDLVPQLREVSQARKLGVTVIDGLNGEVYWNKSKGGVTAEHLNTEAEASGTETVATFDQIKLAPRPIAAFVPLSFQMRNQPAMALEDWVRSEIVTAIGLLEDQSIFTGDGSNGAPRGVLNHPSINSVTFAGTVYTAAGQTVTDKLMDVVKTTRKKFALGLGNLGWATSPDVLYHLGKVKDAQRRPIFASLTEGNAAVQSAPPTILRYPVVDTEFLDQGAGGTVETLIFGPWKDVILGHWGTLVLDMSEETETNFRKARTTLRGIWQYDVGVFHGDAFTTAHASGAGTIDTTASVA